MTPPPLMIIKGAVAQLVEHPVIDSQEVLGSIPSGAVRSLESPGSSGPFQGFFLFIDQADRPEDLSV